MVVTPVTKYFSSETVNFLKLNCQLYFHLISFHLFPSPSKLSPEYTLTERSPKKAKLEVFWNCFDLAAVYPHEITELDNVDTLSRARTSISVAYSTSNPKSKVDVEMEIYFSEP